jgi:small conductance mechanosensitive channel
MDLNYSLITNWFLTSGLRLAAVIIAALVVAGVAKRAVRSFSQRMVGRAEDKDKLETRKRIQTLAHLAGTLTSLTIYGVAIMIILDQVGIQLGPLLATAGIAGLAVGFGAQSLVKDVISGLFILLENQFNVGDVVEVGGRTGVVERSNLRVTVLRDVEGKVHFVPNGQITTTSNLTKDWSRALLDVGVAYKEDTDQVVEVLRKVAAELTAEADFGPKIMEPLQVMGVQDLADSAVVIRVAFKTKPMEQWGVAREFRRRIKKAFDQEGIEIPFPHRTVYLGEAPTTGRLNVSLTGQADGR